MNTLSVIIFFLTLPTQSMCSILYYLKKTVLTFLAQFINFQENIINLPANIWSLKPIYMKL